jgi:hypothetical protein
MQHLHRIFQRFLSIRMNKEDILTAEFFNVPMRDCLINGSIGIAFANNNPFLE